MGVYDITWSVEGTAQMEADSKEQAIADLEDSLRILLDDDCLVTIVHVDEVA